ADQVATGIAPLDHILPNGGLTRGRLSVWAPQGGASSILRAACHATVAAGERAAWIDGDSTVTGAFWTDGPYLVRPKSRLHALRAAEELLRSGGFSLLVLAGAEPQGTETVRLTRAAREGGAALVTVGSAAAMASLRLTSALVHYRWRRTPFGDPAVPHDATVRVNARTVGFTATPSSPFRCCIMSYVCLWSPSWPTGADFPADLAASLLQHAPRVAIGERSLVWGDARGLHGAALAEDMLHVASDYGIDDARAGVAATPVAAEVAATHSVLSVAQSNAPVVVRPGQDRAFIAPCPLAVLSPAEPLALLLAGLGIETCGALAALEAESIEVRLGAEGVRLWRRARADDERWLFKLPIRALPSASLEWVEYGLKDPERLLFVVNSLAGNVCASLVERG